MFFFRPPPWHRPWAQTVLIVLAVALVPGQFYGCKPPDDGANGDGVADSNDAGTADGNADSTSAADAATEQAVEADLARASVADDSLTQSLDNGASTPEALATLMQSLLLDPGVTSVMMGDEGETVWAVYASGVEHVFAVLDGDEEDAPPEDAPIQPTAQRRVPPLYGLTEKLSAAQPAGVSNLNSKVPASTKAVVANSLTMEFPSQDSTGVVEKILKGCGYEVTRVSADLELFKQLSQFGVIYIEAHGWPDPVTTPNAGPLCRGAGGTMILKTTTPVTTGPDGNFKQYVKDLVCGRVHDVGATVRREGQKAQKARVYGVTANFVRQYDQGRFPDRTLMCLGACRGFKAADLSEWTDLLNERGTGARFLGWSRRTHYGLSARAFLNLFQIGTGSNEQFAMIQVLPGSQLGNGYILLEKNVPPPVPHTVGLALQALKAKGWDTDPKTGSQLLLAGEKENEMITLVPSLLQLVTFPGPRAIMSAFCDDTVELRIGDKTISIGTVNDTGAYNFPLPGAIYGPMTLYQGGRYCPPRTLFAWDVPLTLTYDLGDGGTCTANWRLRARAHATAYPNGIRFMEHVWDAVTGTGFDARFDSDGASLTWGVTGDFNDSIYLYQWRGNGAIPVTFKLNGVDMMTNFHSLDGQTAILQATCEQQITYTLTKTKIEDGSVETTNGTLLAGLQAQPSVGADLSLLAGSYANQNCTISWSNVAPKPAFNSDTEPR
jgi:hypothetical protein